MLDANGSCLLNLCSDLFFPIFLIRKWLGHSLGLYVEGGGRSEVERGGKGEGEVRWREGRRGREGGGGVMRASLVKKDTRKGQTETSNILHSEVSYLMVESHVHEVAMHVCPQKSGSNQVG